MNNFGLIGRKLSHSFSKKFFNQKFLEENIPAHYENYELNDIAMLRTIFESKVISGLNVTVPYKNSVIKYLDSLDALAKQTMAVNTILPKYDNNGKLLSLRGYNTDVFGFHQMLKPFLKSHHERALILGTGGASSSVSHVMKEYNIDVNFISRFPDANNNNIFSWNDLNEYMVEHHLLIINTTPIGMYPNSNEIINIPYHAIGKSHLIIDLIYNPKETHFLKNSKKNNAQTLNGHSMLINQALKAWNIWNP